jgi:hypothetical protein
LAVVDGCERDGRELRRPDSPTRGRACAAAGLALGLRMIHRKTKPPLAGRCENIYRNSRNSHGLPLCACRLGARTAIRFMTTLFGGGASRQYDNDGFHECVLRLLKMMGFGAVPFTLLCKEEPPDEDNADDRKTYR